MKKLLLAALLMMPAAAGFAQDNLTVKDGRMWHSSYSREMVITGVPYDEYLSGDTVIDNHSCLKYYRTCEAMNEKDNYIGAVYEENHQVYLYARDKWSLLYDFNMKAGDVAEVRYGKVKVLDVDTIEVNGVRHKRMRMADVVDGSVMPDAQWGYWVEGIGGDRGFGESSGWNLVGSSLGLMECQDGDNVIFTWDDFRKPSVWTRSNLTVKEGRRWSQAYFYYLDIETNPYKPFDEYLSGDTIIDGRHGLKLYRTFEWKDMKDQVVGALYEEDHKVYANMAGEQGWKLLYDFKLNAGDICGSYRVLGVDTIQVQGVSYRRMSMIEEEALKNWENGLYEGMPEDDFYRIHTGYWVEGIGSDEGLLHLGSWGYYSSNSYMFNQCSDDGKVIFTLDDFKKAPTSTIRGLAPAAGRDAVTEVYTLGGRLVSKGHGLPSLPKGLYIVKTGGQTQKRVIGE